MIPVQLAVYLCLTKYETYTGHEVILRLLMGGLSPNEKGGEGEKEEARRGKRGNKRREGADLADRGVGGVGISN